MTNVLLPAQHNVDYDGSLVTLSAQGAGVVNGPLVINEECSGAIVVVDVTAITGTSPTLVVALQMFDVASGKWVTLGQTASITTVSTVFFTVYPTGSAVANVSYNIPLPRNWRVIATVGGTTPSVTATVGVNVIK